MVQCWKCTKWRKIDVGVYKCGEIILTKADMDFDVPCKIFKKSVL